MLMANCNETEAHIQVLILFWCVVCDGVAGIECSRRGTVLFGGVVGEADLLLGGEKNLAPTFCASNHLFRTRIGKIVLTNIYTSYTYYNECAIVSSSSGLSIKNG